MCSATRMSDEYGTLFAMPPPVPTPFRETSTRNTARTPLTPHNGCGISGRCDHFCDFHQRLHYHRGSLPPVWRGIGCHPQPRKSKALALGSWCARQTFRWIAYHPSVTILGVTFWGTIQQTTKDTWARLTEKLRRQAHAAYNKGPCIANRIRYVNTFLLSKIWYVSQILPPPNIYIHQLTTAITWYI